MKSKAFRLGVLGILVLSLLLSSCAKPRDDRRIRIFSRNNYMDESVFDIFEEETGIDVEMDYYHSNEDMYNSLKDGKSNAYDLCITSDYMIKRLISEKMLAEIDYKSLPNYKNIADQYKNLPFDPENKYSVPYMWGTLCIAYDPAVVTAAPDNWSALWNEKYSGKIIMPDSRRETIAAALMKLGYSVNTKDEKQLSEAKAQLLKQKNFVLKYASDDAVSLLADGKSALAVVRSSYVGLIRAKNEKIKFVIPKDGSVRWYDSIVMLKNTSMKKEAQQFIDFLCRTDIAEMNRVYLQSSTPNEAVSKNLPDEIKKDPVLYPPKAVLDKCRVFEDIPSADKLYAQIWSKVSAGNE